MSESPSAVMERRKIRQFHPFCGPLGVPAVAALEKLGASLPLSSSARPLHAPVT